VGKRIRNHVIYNIEYAGTHVSYPNFQDLSGESIEYGLTQTGFYASPVGQGSVQARIKTLPKLVDADIGLLFSFITSDLFTKPFTFSVLTAVPEYANGTLTLASADPLVNPTFTPNEFPDADARTLVRGIKETRRIMDQPAARVYFGREITPGPEVSTDEELFESVRDNAGYIYHYFGSNKMGNEGDSLRVVDPELRVVGVKGLRVIDSSVIPGHSSIVIQSTTCGIAEKGAAMILEAYHAQAAL